MIFAAALLAALLGLLLGGSLKKLFNLNLRHIELLLVAAVAGLLPRMPVVGPYLSPLGMPGAVAVAVLRYGAVVAFAVLNRKSLPVLAIGLGGILNFAATIANGGAMPVTAAAMNSGSGDAALQLLKSGKILNYKLADAHTKLLPLCDILRLRFYDIYFVSAGDILIAVGVCALILTAMEPKLVLRLKKHIKGSP